MGNRVITALVVTIVCALGLLVYVLTHTQQSKAPTAVESPTELPLPGESVALPTPPAPPEITVSEALEIIGREQTATVRSATPH